MRAFVVGGKRADAWRKDCAAPLLILVLGLTACGDQLAGPPSEKPSVNPEFVLLGPVARIDAGDAHTCAIGVDGNIACWGGNDAGAAIPPAGLGPVTQVTAGRHTCALEVGGTVGWGRNDSNQSTVPATLNTVGALAYSTDKVSI